MERPDLARNRRAERRGDPRWTLFGRFDPFEVPLRRGDNEARCGTIPRRGTLLGRRGLGGRRVRAARRRRIEAPPWANGVLYHSRDDETVPFAHLALYAEKLPRATVKEFDGRGHQFDDDLSEVARDIGRL